MSQNPYPQPPYQPPYPQGYQQTYGYPQPDPLAPAKRASVLMIVIGSLSLLCGVCFTSVGLMYDKFPPESRQQFQQMEQQLHGISAQTLLVGLGLVVLLPGILLIVMGIFVRGGGMGAVITSIVLCSLMIIGSAISLVGGLVSPSQRSGACIWFVALALFVLLLVWLIQAAKAAPHVAAAKQNYANQYYQYQQQQAAYLQPPQQPFPPGYSPAPPPPPPQAPPPPGPGDSSDNSGLR